MYLLTGKWIKNIEREHPCNGINYKFTTTAKINLKCIFNKGKESNPKYYVLCDGIYIIFWKRQNFWNRIKICTC